MLPDLAARLGMSDRVHWAGIRDEGWRLLAGADLYVQPSREEGIGLAILEAMALGLPVIGSRVGGIPEAVAHGRTGYVVEPADPEQLAVAIERLLSSPSTMREMGQAGRDRYLELFSGEASVTAIANMYGTP